MSPKTTGDGRVKDERNSKHRARLIAKDPDSVRSQLTCRRALKRIRNICRRNVFETLEEENCWQGWICSMFARCPEAIFVVLTKSGKTERLTGRESGRNLSGESGIQVEDAERAEREVKEMTTWHKRDWKQFYELARRPWRKHRPPRPVYPTGMNRVLPAAGFSLSELDDAGVDLDQAESLGLPVDAGRIGAYGPNVTVLRDFVRSSRHPL
jgi:ribosomal protein L13E